MNGMETHSHLPTYASSPSMKLTLTHLDETHGEGGLPN